MTNPNITPELERAARAIAESLNFDWSEINDDYREMFYSDVRAVLRSLLPPSEGMVEAGRKVERQFGDPWDMAIADEIFTAMIQHVLGEREG